MADTAQFRPNFSLPLNLMKEQPKAPLLKRLMDNPWLLLVLGVGIPMVSYTLWGWIELYNVTPAQLP